MIIFTIKLLNSVKMDDKKIILDTLGSGKVYNIHVELNIRKREGHGLATAIKTKPLGSIPKEVFNESVVLGLLSAHIEAIKSILSKNGAIDMLQFSKQTIDRNIEEIRNSKKAPKVNPSLN